MLHFSNQQEHRFSSMKCFRLPIWISSCSLVYQFFVFWVEFDADAVPSEALRDLCGRPASDERIEDGASGSAPRKNARLYQFWRESSKMRRLVRSGAYLPDVSAVFDRLPVLEAPAFVWFSCGRFSSRFLFT